MSQTYILRRDGCDYQAPDLQTMRTWAQDGRVLPTDMVYSPRYQSWYRARDLRELRDVLPRVESRPPAAARPVPSRPVQAASQPSARPQTPTQAPTQAATQAQAQQRATQQFWLRKGEKNYAADSLQTILRWAAEGNISPDDYIYHPSYNKWFRAGDSPQLASRFPRTAAEPTAAAAPSTTAAEGRSVEGADSVQRTVMDFRAAELHRMIQARKAELDEERGRGAKSSGSSTRRGMVIRPEDVGRSASADEKTTPVKPAARPKTGRLSGALADASRGASLDDRSTEPLKPIGERRTRRTAAQARPTSAVTLTAKAKPEAARPTATKRKVDTSKLPKLPTLKPIGAPESPKPLGTPKPIRAPESPKPIRAPESPKPIRAPESPKPVSAKPAAAPHPEVAKPEAASDGAGRRVGPPALPESIRPSGDVRSDPPAVAPLEDAGTGVDQGMAVPPDAGAAIAVRYADRLNLMRPLYDVARVFVVTRDLRPSELQETKCGLPRSGDEFQGQAKRGIYQTLALRIREHLEGKVADSKPMIEQREMAGYLLFVERVEHLLSVMEAADAVIGQKPPERFVIGNSGRDKMSPGEEASMLSIDAAFKGLISIKAKG